jgi:hypothetical protein
MHDHIWWSLRCTSKIEAINLYRKMWDDGEVAKWAELKH